jgi:hypothetical protein
VAYFWGWFSLEWSSYSCGDGEATVVVRSVMLQVCTATARAVPINGMETVTPVVVAELPVVVSNNVIPEKDVLYLPSPVGIWKYKQKTGPCVLL